MKAVKRFKVEVKKDHLSKVASGSPETALAEMIWNSLDADATEVALWFQEGPLGVESIHIKDNGTGIEYKKAKELFISLGGSWKALKQRTDNGRFIHGKDGEGRFKAFVLGRVVDWNIIYKNKGDYYQYIIEGKADSLDEFSASEENISTTDKTGVEVVISELSKKFHILEQSKAIDKLTPIFALYLSNYPTINLKINGSCIKIEDIIQNKEKIVLASIIEENVTYDIELEIIEWKGLKEKELWLCDEHGFPLEIYNNQIRGIGDFGFSGYLKSDYLRKLNEEGTLSLGDLNEKINQLCEQATKEIKDYFVKRTLEQAKNQLEKWKEEKVYPFEDDPQTPVEIAERQVFDIVAINVHQTLPDFEQTNHKAKAFQLRMLRQAIEKSPEELQLIMSEVLQLPKSKQEQLAELLRETSLSSIISASKLVADRIKFISGLEHMLFDVDIKKIFKERSQLHRILAENTWIFGHAFSLSVDDKSLTEVLKKHAKIANIMNVIDDPVKRLDGSKGIVDLMLSRSIPRSHSNELEHLIVELKAPSVVVGSKEIGQIESYAFAVAKDERFRGINTRWNFWIVSNDIDDYAKMKLSQEQYEDGIIYKTAKPIDLTIWIKTWSQLIQENKHRLEFIREKLNYNISREDALEYLKKTYAEYTKGLISSSAKVSNEVITEKSKLIKV